MKRKGFSLFEFLIAGVILSAGLLPLLLLYRSSNQVTLDASSEFLAMQLAQEPLEVFRGVGYPACTKLVNYPVDRVTLIDPLDDRYPAEAAGFERLIRVDTSNPSLCLVTVQVFPRSGSKARSWLRPEKAVMVLKGVVPVVH